MTYQEVCASAFVIKILELGYCVYYWMQIKFHVSPYAQSKDTSTSEKNIPATITPANNVQDLQCGNVWSRN